eukprot:352057-Chlamydomonas_euryale.AAC.1
MASAARAFNSTPNHVKEIIAGAHLQTCTPAQAVQSTMTKTHGSMPLAYPSFPLCDKGSSLCPEVLRPEVVSNSSTLAMNIPDLAQSLITESLLRRHIDILLTLRLFERQIRGTAGTEILKYGPIQRLARISGCPGGSGLKSRPLPTRPPQKDPAWPLCGLRVSLLWSSHHTDGTISHGYIAGLPAN